MKVPSRPSRNNVLVIAAKYYTEADFKVSKSCSNLLNFYT